MITQIENALVERLQKGLGRLVTTVKSYNGELDDESIGTARFPLVLVSFGGSRISRKSISAKRYQSKATFVVLLVVSNLRNETARRQGGVDSREIGVNQLIGAVRRLLDSQTLGNLVNPLLPVRVQTVLNGARVKANRLTAYAVEYEVSFDDIAPLEDGLYPQPTTDKSNPDYIFNQYQGLLSPVDELHQVGGIIFDPTSDAQVPFCVETKEKI
ncbi:DUF1834 family protein [Caviibacterium pharyngocola]|uniref:DUF1834 domain-containing protein n=1 Tax=Caviibacterium pharyngocola TaxID=28159 RepID=A0A2M8RY02_9PAST|nr:DUF1834 family protein [Caviibacterium pharyngocola]PJG83770.1 hypothetical protein CVP04_01370 [Caviibacterium pharyngocola]